MGLLDGGLQGLFGEAFAVLYLDATLTRVEIVGGVDYDPTSGTEVVTEYQCKAQEDRWGQAYIAGSLVAADDRKIIVLQSSLSTTPRPGDTITVRGTTSTIVSDGAGQPGVAQDPAATHWVLRTRT